jgi:CrcB protein
MIEALIAGFGGFVGSVGRYALSMWVTTKLADETLFPWGTLSVNIIGSIAIGALVGGIAELGDLSERMRLLLVVGVLGGFTTFSAFSNETFALARGGQALMAFTYVAATLALSIAAVWAGYSATRAIAS